MVAYHLFKEVLLPPTFLYENDKIVGFCPTILNKKYNIVGFCFFCCTCIVNLRILIFCQQFIALHTASNNRACSWHADGGGLSTV